MAGIRVTAGPESGKRYALKSDRSVLGRHPECDIVLDVAAVSRQHARIFREGSRFYAEDMGSRNGTFVNDKQIQGRQQLVEGDQLKICDLTFEFFEQDPADSLAGPMPDGNNSSSLAMLIDDDGGGGDSHSAVIPLMDVTSSQTGSYLAARPEVKLRAMIEIAQNLGRAISVDEVLPKLLDSLFKIFPQADRGFIVLKAGDRDVLIPKAVRHRRAGTQEMARISRTIVNQAMNSREAILSADAASDERFNMAQSIADFQIRSLMCAPLLESGGAAIGVIQIDTLDRRSHFTPDDLEVLASVASQAAIAVDNAQLHEQSLRQRALERDLELAHKVQQGLLPSEPPKIPGYRFFDFYESAHQVGGDYYDYIPLPGGRIAVVVADVSGKGVSAALLMARLAGDVRFCLASTLDHAEAVRAINAAFSANGWDDRFVTFIVAVLDPARHEVTIVNAGHMAPLVRHSGGQVEEIGADKTGLPLGVADDFQYEACTRQLAPGDFLTLYTDGISEAMNAENDWYGTERLRAAIGAQALSVAELGQHVLDDVRKFVGGHPQSDDMCVACFGRTE